MTIVCCWLDNSYSRSRITAIADARASVRLSPTVTQAVNDNTTKLFKTIVNCYELSGLNMATGSWDNPYFSTEIGLGYAGSCYEAMSIIALFQRCASQLVSDAVPASKPRPDGIATMLVEIAARWFSTHVCADDVTVTFLLFGFSPLDGKPWAAEIRCTKAKGVRLENVSWDLTESETYICGDMALAGKQDIEKFRHRIQKHGRSVRDDRDTESRCESELARAKHSIAEKKFLEKVVLDDIASEFRSSIGGVLQKIEIVPIDGNRGVASYSRHDATDILDGLSQVGNNLGFIPTAAALGWN